MSSLADPYRDNVLISELGSIPSPQESLAALLYLPTAPRSVDGVERHIRLHSLMAVRDIYIPPVVGRHLFETVDLMVRQGYRYRDPKDASTWARISGESPRRGALLPSALAAAVEGISGVGKTQACARSLLGLPQIVQHRTFPRLQGGQTQVVWLSVEVPPSGKASDLARELMQAWDNATGGSRFRPLLAKGRMTDGMSALAEWRQVAMSNFLGVLHLDEIQNLFKLSSLRQRRDRKGQSEAPELSIVEDQLLRWILQLSNSGPIPLLVSGTPDGVGALTRRLSTLQRLNTCGYYPFEPFDDPKSPDFLKTFLGQLGRYQYVKNRIPVDENLARLILDLTAGIQRIIVALWVSAHRVAFERKDDSLKLSDFTTAASTWLAPLAPAVHALRTKDPYRMGRYEDLVRRDTTFWAKFWTHVTH